MGGERLDPRATKRVSGVAWAPLRGTFERLNEALLGASPTVRGQLTTIYVKYASPETGGQPFAVLWARKTDHLVLGLALPEGMDAPGLTEPPPGHTYAGLTRYQTFKPGDAVPDQLAEWVAEAYRATVTT